MNCYVCNSSVAIHGHHIIPQGRGGKAGPVVPLCATCHNVVHNVASAMRSGKSGDDKLAHLGEDSRLKVQALVQVILLADIQSPGNPNPLVSVVLDDPAYLVALHRFKIDSGFTSIAAAINGVCRLLAVRYGIVDDDAKNAKSRIKIDKLRDFRNT